MSLKKLLLIIGAVFVVCLIFMAGYLIKSYRNLEQEVKIEFLSALSTTNNTSPEKTLSQPVIISKNTVSRGDINVSELLGTLRLLGTAMGNPVVAYIEDLTKSRMSAYRVGDAISGAKILNIQRGEVTLGIDGQKGVLFLTASKEKAVTKISPTKMVISKKGVLSEIGGDINEAFKTAKILPHLDLTKGKFSGFKVDNIQKGSIAEDAGLQNGDIIKAVSGQQLDTPQRALQVLRKARNQSQITVDLIRGSQQIRLNYEIRD